MTFPNTTAFLDRLADARKARERELATVRRALTTGADRFGSPYAVGDRVFDTVTGDHGRVARIDPAPTGGGVELLIDLDAGPRVTRDPSTLIDRPSER